MVQNPQEVFAAALLPIRVQERGLVPHAMNVATTAAPPFLKSRSRRSPNPQRAIESPMIRTDEGSDAAFAARTRGIAARAAKAPIPATKRRLGITFGSLGVSGLMLTRPCVSKGWAAIQL